MATMGRYCKAYPISSVRAFDQWNEKSDKHSNTVSNPAAEDTPTHEECVFLQENYTVTDGIFLDSHIVFGEVTDRWKEFCRSILGFEPEADAPTVE